MHPVLLTQPEPIQECPATLIPRQFLPGQVFNHYLYSRFQFKPLRFV